MENVFRRIPLAISLSAILVACGGGVDQAAAPSSTGAQVVSSAAAISTASTVVPTTTATSRERVKIMPLGDSITERADYRRPLQAKLASAGCSVDFVGGRKDQTDALGVGDPDHEGHGGFRADQIADGARAWAAAAAPAFVMVHVGTNDFYQNQDVASTVADVKRLLSELKAAAPKATILLAQIIPGAGIEKPVAELDALLVGLADGASVRIVNQQQGVNAATDTVDGAHPNAALGEQMAQRWFDVLHPLLGAACIR